MEILKLHPLVDGNDVWDEQYICWSRDYVFKDHYQNSQYLSRIYVLGSPFIN